MTPEQLNKLQEAILQAFTEDDLRQLVFFELGQSLATLVGPGPFKKVVFDLLAWAERKGQTRALLEAVQKAVPGRKDVQAITGKLLAEMEVKPPVVEARPKAVPAAAAAPMVGVITALPLETAAVLAVLGETREAHVAGVGAGRRYWRGSVTSAGGGRHEVVVAQADMGNNSAATRATQLLTHFPGVQSIVMCGIAGGIPQPDKPEEHVRLGDVVVSDQRGVVQYDFVKRTRKGRGSEVREEFRGPPRPPSAELLEAVRVLEVGALMQNFPWEPVLADGLARLKWTRPGEEMDRLADAGAAQKWRAHPEDPARRAGQPRVFRGPIGSANVLQKDATRRDELRERFGVLAVEMEGSGIADATWTHGVGYLVVRGVCDYCDAHKNDVWQRYAALAAAAYVRALLASMPGVQPAVGRAESRVGPGLEGIKETA